MPRKNTIKSYVENGIYHVYNRGVEKRIIFQDEQDHKTFLKYLKEALSPPKDKKDLLVDITLKGDTFKGIARQPKNFFGKIDLIAYCMMPNHFHLLLKQTSKNDLKEFIQSVATRYSMFFNKKYKRVGALFQSAYKAVLISDDPYLLHLSRYIHLNPSEYFSDLTKAFSSYAEYLGIRKTKWIKPELVLSQFTQTKLPFLKNITTYQSFVEEFQKDSTELLGELILEE